MNIFYKLLIRGYASKTKNLLLDFECLSLIFGTVLGDSGIYKRKNARGSYLQLTQGVDNYEYLIHIWNILHSKGLTTDYVPALITRKTGYGISIYATLHTYTLPELNFLKEAFYVENSCMEYSVKKGTFKLTNSKRVPFFIG
jgi:hypothetical protein